MATTIQICIFTLLLIGSTYCQISNDLDVDDIEKQVKDSIPGLENFNRSSLPSEEDFEKFARKKCEKNGGSDEAYEALKNQQESVRGCLEQQLNFTQIQEEIEEAKKTGSMDEVFGKYCKKYPEIHKCIEGVTESVKPCLDAKEKEAMEKAIKIAEELREFLCFKDGDRLAMFIAEGGVECLESRKEQLQDCANKTLGSRIPADFSVDNLPTFLFSERDCRDFDTVRSCVNTELEKCKDTTPANIVDAFFKFLKKHMPCDFVVQKAQVAPSSSTTFVISSSIMIMSVLILL